MNKQNSPNPYEKVYALLQEGKKIEAIKILREETGLSLIESKEFVEKFEKEKFQKKSSSVASGSVLEILRNGSKIEAIKKYREETGMGLKDSKEAVEKIIDENPDVKKQMDEVNKEKLKRTVIYLILFILVILVLVNLF